MQPGRLAFVQVVAVLIDLVLIGGLVLWIRLLMKFGPSTSNIWVLRHLRKTGNARVRHVWTFEGVWNPGGRANVDDRVYGPGEALYTLDEAGIVHLEFHERGGRVRRLSGPLPVRTKHPKHEPTPHSLKVIRRAATGFAAVMITGYVVGWELGGPSFQRRMEDGWIGQMAVMSLALLAIGLYEVKRHAMTGSQGKKTSV
jgi:hypothetical protein